MEIHEDFKQIIYYDEINTSLIKLKGIYIVYMLCETRNIIYIGKSKNIYKRLKEHKYQKNFKYVVLIPCVNSEYAFYIEKLLISNLDNKFNINSKSHNGNVYPKNGNNIEEFIEIHKNCLNR